MAGETFSRETNSWSVTVPYEEIDALVAVLEEAATEHRSRDLLAHVESLIDGTGIAVAYATVWKGQEMVAVGLFIPGDLKPDRSVGFHGYPTDVEKWVRSWIAVVERGWQNEKEG